MKYKLTDLYKQLKEEEQATQVSQYKIFCDMDGVLCDFDRRFEQFGGMKPKEYESRFGTKKFWELIDKVGEQFWSKMPWMSDGKQLWIYISKYKPVLLSAPSMNPSSRYGKHLWVNENLPGTKLILAKREKKRNYSGKNQILIDDRPDNINEWVYEGGIGILHTSAQQTINDLKELGL
jgi:hypothetical protein